MKGRSQGFSLIEMLVVMTIMGLIVSVVTLSTGSLSALFGGAGDGSADSIADELMVQMRAASSQAILSGEPMALGFALPSTAPGTDVVVTWLRYGRVTDGAVRTRQALWQPAPSGSELQEVTLPSDIHSELRIEGEMISARALTDSPGTPALVFYPTGDSTAFEWSLSHDEQVVTLSNATTGDIQRRQP